MRELTPLLDGLGFPESIRWHDGRAWLCNWGTGAVLAVTAPGSAETPVQLSRQALPYSIDWLIDGRLLVVDGPRRRLLVHNPDDGLAPFADLTAFGPAPFNELVSDGLGGAFVNGGSGLIVHVDPQGIARVVADGLQWPNGMALLQHEQTLVVADSHTRQLLAFDIEHDRSLSGRRIWASLADAPDGICADVDDTIWVASVPGQHCIRVAAGGDEIDRVNVGQAAFSCALGGPGRRTLFIGAADWPGMAAAMSAGPGTTGRLLATDTHSSPGGGT